MNRREIVHELVLNAICDDYENVDQCILRGVAEEAAKRGLTIERPDVVGALAELIAAGLAKAYILSGTEPWRKELAGMPPLDEIEEYFKTYFYITKKGLDLHLSYDDAITHQD